jgi:CTP synthase (UTP-ammonia lyase)
MTRVVRIGLVGDFDPSVTAHQAIPRALALAGARAGHALRIEWVPTEAISGAARVAACDGLWCVPASPYRSAEGALTAIGCAREREIPFLGTCGGFQHALLEHARSVLVLGWRDAEHAETAPDARRPVISQLACALVETTDLVRLVPGSRIATAYGRTEAAESYHCRYGLNPALGDELLTGGLQATAFDGTGDVRAVERSGHPFFVATLFQPERAALRGETPPLVTAFVHAAAARAAP